MTEDRQRPVLISAPLSVTLVCVRIRSYYLCPCGVENYVDKQVYVEDETHINAFNGYCWSCGAGHIIRSPFVWQQTDGAATPS